jgi:hypothetical protein
MTQDISGPLTWGVLCACFCCRAIVVLQRYNFDKHALLLTLVQMTGSLAQHKAFPQVRLDSW